MPLFRAERPFAAIARSSGGAAIALLMLSSAEAEATRPPENIDAEHIFGFTEGSDIGEKGEIEFENTSVARLGREGGYATLQNEAAFRYGVADGLRASLGLLADYHYSHDVPGLDDRNRGDFSGLTSEFRWAALARDQNPFGLTLSATPEWRRVDQLSGARLENYNLPLTALVDFEPIPRRLVAAVNFTYSPGFERFAGGWQIDHAIEISGAASFALTPSFFVGAEIRHDDRFQSGVATGHALYVGPSIFLKFSDAMSIKLTWSAQIVDPGASRLDLTNYERHQILLLLVKSF